MARYTGPKSKIARKLGAPIFGADKVLSKKNYPPGQHGNNRRRKTSEYGIQLKEKQKAKYTYGVSARRVSRVKCSSSSWKAASTTSSIASASLRRVQLLVSSSRTVTSPSMVR